MGVCGQRHAPAAMSLKKTRYTQYRRQGGPQYRFGGNVVPTGIRSRDHPARCESLYTPTGVKRPTNPILKFVILTWRKVPSKRGYNVRFNEHLSLRTAEWILHLSRHFSAQCTEYIAFRSPYLFRHLAVSVSPNSVSRFSLISPSRAMQHCCHVSMN